ncbi:DUF5367 family protein [Reichenbachiella sp.]|uniref:DUF5367 family protein n=1 Tax=Reichenbachiella sp. TaxID=2184521 RepID=UPI00329A1BF0
MKIIRAILVAILIWLLGVMVFMMAYSVRLVNDLELQSNLALATALIPLGWYGTKYYYRKGSKFHGQLLGLVMVSTAIFLDVIITVPLLIIPAGGNYLEFFGAISFWLIAMEYFLVILIYWRLNVKTPVYTKVG